MQFRHIIILPLIFHLLLLSSCVREEAVTPEVIAKVGDRILTAGEVNAWEASLHQGDVPQEVRAEFIRHWVEEEILFQAALENELDRDPWVVQRLDDIARTLMVARLLEQEQENLAAPSLVDIKNYFQAHSAEFVWTQLHLVVDYWSSPARTGMEQLRSHLLRGNDFNLFGGTVVNLEKNRIALSGAQSTTPSVWRIVSAMRMGEITPVLYLSDRYWIFKLIEQHQEGELQELEDVRDEIVARLTDQARRNKREEMIRSLVGEYQRSGRLQWQNAAPVVTLVDSIADTTAAVQ